jgi:hypothetical protein
MPHESYQYFVATDVSLNRLAVDARLATFSLLLRDR